MNIKDMLISALLKKGILYEGRNTDITIDIPNASDNSKIKVQFKAENMTIRIDKE